MSDKDHLINRLLLIFAAACALVFCGPLTAVNAEDQDATQQFSDNGSVQITYEVVPDPEIVVVPTNERANTGITDNRISLAAGGLFLSAGLFVFAAETGEIERKEE